MRVHVWCVCPAIVSYTPSNIVSVCMCGVCVSSNCIYVPSDIVLVCAVDRANSFACNTLDTLEENVPLITLPTEEVCYAHPAFCIGVSNMSQPNECLAT